MLSDQLLHMPSINELYFIYTISIKVFKKREGSFLYQVRQSCRLYTPLVLVARFRTNTRSGKEFNIVLNCRDSLISFLPFFIRCYRSALLLQLTITQKTLPIASKQQHGCKGFESTRLLDYQAWQVQRSSTTKYNW